MHKAKRTRLPAGGSDSSAGRDGRPAGTAKNRCIRTREGASKRRARVDELSAESVTAGGDMSGVRDAVRTFVLYKSFDLISDGEYKKLVVRCKENGDAWAEAVYSQVQQVGVLSRSISTEINTLEDYGKCRLRRVCVEVLAWMTPPARRRPGWSMCSITGVRSDDCIDLTRVGKSGSVVTVDKRFSHFLLMLWLVMKFEHVCKVVARNWYGKHQRERQTHSSGGKGSLTVNEMCNAFESEFRENIDALVASFIHAFQHVMASLQEHKLSPNTEVLDTEGIGGVSPAPRAAAEGGGGGRDDEPPV